MADFSSTPDDIRISTKAVSTCGYAFLGHARVCFICVVLLISVALQLSPSIAWTAEAGNDEAARQFAFAEALFTEGDYFRAITEYKRLVFFSPKDDLAEKSLFRIAESYFKARRWKEAVDAFDDFHSKYRQSARAAEALYFKGLAEKELKRYENALSTFQEIIRTKSEGFADKSLYQSALIHLETEKWQKSKETFLLIPDSSPIYSSARTFSSGLERMDDIPRKSPALAGSLAAILPGAGHVFTERYLDATMAFLLNGAFILAAVELVRHDIPAAAGVVAFFELGWYTGNIYSAVSSAHKYNEREKNSYLQKLKESGSVSMSYNPASSTSLVAFTYKF